MISVFTKTSLLTIVVGMLVVAGVAYYYFAQGKVYYYDDYFKLPHRPFPTERLLLVTKVKGITPRRTLKAASIIPMDYVMSAECLDKTISEKLTIQFTKPQWSEMDGLAVGEIFAAFGLDSSRKIIFRIEKYSGSLDEPSIRQWFAGLK